MAIDMVSGIILSLLVTAVAFFVIMDYITISDYHSTKDIPELYSFSGTSDDEVVLSCPAGTVLNIADAMYGVYDTSGQCNSSVSNTPCTQCKNVNIKSTKTLTAANGQQKYSFKVPSGGIFENLATCPQQISGLKYMVSGNYTCGPKASN